MSDDLLCDWLQRLTELTGIDYGRYIRIPADEDSESGNDDQCSDVRVHERISNNDGNWAVEDYS